MDRKRCHFLRNALNAALEDLGTDLGMSVKALPGGNFDRTTLVIKVEFAELNGEGEALSREARMFDTLAILYGLPKEVRGWQFTSRGTRYTITGLAPKAKRYPVLAQAGNGITYKFPSQTVKECLLQEYGVKFTALFNKGSVNGDK